MSSFSLSERLHVSWRAIEGWDARAGILVMTRTTVNCEDRATFDAPNPRAGTVNGGNPRIGRGTDST